MHTHVITTTTSKLHKELEEWQVASPETVQWSVHHMGGRDWVLVLQHTEAHHRPETASGDEPRWNPELRPDEPGHDCQYFAEDMAACSAEVPHDSHAWNDPGDGYVYRIRLCPGLDGPSPTDTGNLGVRLLRAYSKQTLAWIRSQMRAADNRPNLAAWHDLLRKADDLHHMLYAPVYQVQDQDVPDASPLLPVEDKMTAMRVAHDILAWASKRITTPATAKQKREQQPWCDTQTAAIALIKALDATSE